MATLKDKEINEKADDIIGLLAGFDIPFADAARVLYRAYDRMTNMKEREYMRSGGDVKSLTGMLDKRDGVIPNGANVLSSEARARVFHEPIEND